MSTSTHPDDLDLFEYVEGELDDPRLTAVREHVGSCARCSDEIRLLEAGKHALRESAFLNLPERRRSLIVPGLPKQERERWRRPAWTPRRLVAVLAPVAAVAAVVAVVTSTTGGNGEEQAAVPAAAEPEAAADQAPEAAPPEALQAAPAEEPAGGAARNDAEAFVAPVIEVTGPAVEVERVLRQAGFAASVTERGVEVSGADPEAVRQALFGRPAGDVAVFVAP